MTDPEIKELFDSAMATLERVQMVASIAKSPLELQSAMRLAEAAKQQLKLAMEQVSREIHERIQ